MPLVLGWMLTQVTFLEDRTSSNFFNLFLRVHNVIFFSMIYKLTLVLYVVSWWQLHDGTAKELSAMALRILRLTCGSLAYEPSWIEMVT
jgi:hypothetical protein